MEQSNLDMCKGSELIIDEKVIFFATEDQLAKGVGEEQWGG